MHREKFPEKVGGREGRRAAWLLGGRRLQAPCAGAVQARPLLRSRLRCCAQPPARPCLLPARPALPQVPFRLTRMMVKAMEVSGIEGNFRWVCGCLPDDASAGLPLALAPVAPPAQPSCPQPPPCTAPPPPPTRRAGPRATR